MTACRVILPALACFCFFLLYALMASPAWGDMPPLPEDVYVIEAPRSDGFDEGKELGNDLAAEELLLFEELPVVISSTRQAQRIDFSSAPVTVITADDIHYSGLTTVPDVLDFALGVDILRPDRNRAAIGVRGMHHSFAERTLFLINGRDASTPVYGGVDFGRLPLLLEDIQRIEIVRGPTSAAWGANAFNGVVNVITKKPTQVHGFFGTSTVNEFGDTYSHVRWAADSGNWGGRLSLGYEEYDSSQEVLGADDLVSRDAAENFRLDSEAIRRVWKDTELSLGFGYGHAERGSFEVGTRPASNDEDLDTLRAHVRLDHELRNGSSGYIQWLGSFEDIARPLLWSLSSAQNDVETQWSLAWHPKHQILVGANVRLWDLDFREPTSDQSKVVREPLDDQSVGAFVLDRWQASDRLAVEGQIRGDYYSGSGADWSGRLSGLYGLDDDQRHVLRLSAARAFRTPLPAVREVSGRAGALPSPPFPPGSFAYTLLRSNDLGNEQTWSIEGGYDGMITEGVVFRADAYYQRYEDLITHREISPPPMQEIMFDNAGGADAVGAEIELCLTRRRWQVSGWYAYNDLQRDRPNQDLRGFEPAKNKVGITGRLFWKYGVVLSSSYKYSDLPAPNAVTDPGADARHRWDVTIAKRFAGDRAELLLGARDLLDETHSPVIEDWSFTGHETPGRVAFVRGQLKF